MRRVSIVLPVYNEAGTIAQMIDVVLRAPLTHNGPVLEKELVIVDDCSQDGTREMLPQIVADAQRRHPEAHMELLLHAANRGKGCALRTGFAHASGEVVMIQDADLEYDPRDYPILLEPILDGWADVVFGNRFHGGPHRVLYFWHYVSNQFLTTLCNLFTGLNLADMEVGYKLFRREVLQMVQLKSDRFGFEPEITIKVARLGARIYEVPIRYHGRTYEEGKKITWRDGVAAIWHILRFRFFD
ncbi:MAG: glycosyltransferase family 2 protein [Acidobacteriales bacterium]|nr:glycosyltransferase family 2 protein [Terriglobales bacterium]